MYLAGFFQKLEFFYKIWKSPKNFVFTAFPDVDNLFYPCNIV